MKPYLFIFLCFSLITLSPWVFSSSVADNSISGDSQFPLYNPNPIPNAGILEGHDNSPGSSSSSSSSVADNSTPEGGSELDVYNPGSSEGHSRSPGRSLLAFNDDYKTRLVALLDGTINLVDSNSQKVLWSFSTGPPIYSSYQVLPDDDTLDGEIKAPPHVDTLDGGARPFFSNKYFIDMGVDWKLYMHGNIFGKVKLEMTISEYLNSLPHISEDGRVTTGSKKTTLFKVDGYSGKINVSYGIGDPNGTHSIVPKEDVEKIKKSRTLYITRTDYSIVGFASSGEVLWNLTAAEIGDALLCEDDKLPRKCLTKSIDIHLRSNNIAEAFKIHALANTNHEVNFLSHIIPSSLQKYNDQGENHDSKYLPANDQGLLALPTRNEANFMIMDNHREDESSHHSNMWKTDLRSMASKILGSLMIFLFVLWYMGLLTVTRYNRDSKQFTESRNNQTVVPKRKKARKLGNNKKSANSENNERSIFSEVGEKTNRSTERNNKEPWLDLTKPINGGSDGRMVGKLFVSNTVIAKGSNGTVVLEGNYETRPVAVKRLVRSHHDVAFKEIQNLIASDRHQNIVRWYGVEYDSDFVYLSLERCMCSLNDLIQICSDSSRNSVFVEDQNVNFVNEYNVSLDSLKENNKDIELWRATGYPSPQLLKMMRDVVSGLAHLHELGIIHRDLKPQNVLILKERSLCAKLSDMGISKRLIGDMSSFSYGATGYGSSGWQAPEQLLHGRQTRAVDLFSLGCVLFFCITGGKHPFGDRLERDINIVNNRVDLFMVEHIPEADDLLSHLLDADPESRPKAVDVLHHPLFWNSEMRLSFLRDTSDRVELEDRESESDLLKALEGVAPVALGGKWDEKMESAFINNIGRYRRYKFDSTRDLLRVIRNKLNHYRELPKEIQELLGPIPEGFDGYFMSRFPKFLIEVYKVMFRYCREEECFRKYFSGELA